MGPAEVLASHPALVVAARRVELAQRELEAVKATPRAAPEVLARWHREQVGQGEGSNQVLGLALRLPLATAERQSPRLAAALGDLDLAEAARGALGIELEAALARARLTADAIRARLGIARVRGERLAERAALVRKAFAAGQVALPETLRAVLAAQEAEATAAREVTNLGFALSRINQALGVMP